jgi:hypothetical protein
VNTKKRRSFTERLAEAFWALVGLGGPNADRRPADPRHDPHRLDFDLITPPQG